MPKTRKRIRSMSRLNMSKPVKSAKGEITTVCEPDIARIAPLDGLVLLPTKLYVHVVDQVSCSSDSVTLVSVSFGRKLTVSGAVPRCMHLAVRSPLLN